MRIGRSDEEESRFTGEQITFALRQADAGTPVADVCRQLGVSELRELRQLRDENTRLKRLVADLTLDRHVRQERCLEKDLRPARRRELALWIHERFQLSERSNGATPARSGACAQPAAVRLRAHTRPAASRGLVGRTKPSPSAVSTGGLAGAYAGAKAKAHQPASRSGASCDDQERVLEHGLRTRSAGKRQGVSLETSFSLTGQSVVDALQQLSLGRSLPKAITVDHGTEFTSRSLDEWAWSNGVKLEFIRPGKPTQNAVIESFNGRLRDECLNVNEFASIEDAKQKIELWRQDYNHHRPHSSLGHLTPNKFAMQGREIASETAKL